jgi:fluoride exporter
MVALTVVLLALGGALGSIARHLVSRWLQQHSHSGFPWGTYIVNGTGSFLIGIVFAVFDRSVIGDDALIFFVGGLLGGYTTFSTFSVENMKLMENRRYGWLLHNAVGQVAGGLIFAALGYALGSVFS